MADELRLPDCSALLSFEAALYAGRWEARELAGLEENRASAPLVDGVRECLPFLDRLATGENKRADQAKLKFANLVCVASKACPDETIRWYQCVQSAASTGAGVRGANVGCMNARKRLERCTQRASSLLVSAALLRGDHSIE
mmetsp:Transcript_10169/g.26394  ORF Transcript_10169/g.26394 Transcript_10169/m.26394 type:complete len:142 (-) Transcript_10169:435-860(-)